MLSCQSVLKVLSPDDGKLRIVQAAQQLCRAVEQREKTSKDINVTVLDSLLRGEEAPRSGGGHASGSYRSLVYCYSLAGTTPLFNCLIVRIKPIDILLIISVLIIDCKSSGINLCCAITSWSTVTLSSPALLWHDVQSSNFTLFEAQEGWRTEIG